MTTYAYVVGKITSKGIYSNKTLKIIIENQIYVVARDKIAESINSLDKGTIIMIEGNLSNNGKSMLIDAFSIEIYSKQEDINKKIERNKNKDFNL